MDLLSVERERCRDRLESSDTTEEQAVYCRSVACWIRDFTDPDRGIESYLRALHEELRDNDDNSSGSSPRPYMNADSGRTKSDLI